MTFQQGEPATTGQMSGGGSNLEMANRGGTGHAQMSGTPRQQQGLTRQEGLSTTQQQALAGITDAIEACAWCADQCIQMGDPGMTQCIQFCEDVQEIGEAAHVLLARNSQHSIPILTTLQQAMEACAGECQQHPHNHCQDCAQTLNRAVQSLSQLTGGGQQWMGGQQGMGGQF